MSTSTAEWAQDPRFEAFRGDNFDAAQFTSRALTDALSSAQSTGNQLRADVKQLESGIRHEVLEKQSALHHIAVQLADMEASCTSVDRNVHQLETSVGKLQSSLDAPYQRLRLRTKQLTNLRGTIDTLRAISRRLKLAKKLRKRVGDAGVELEAVDLPEVARILSDLDIASRIPLQGITVAEWDFCTGKEVDTTGVEVLEADKRSAELVTHRVRSAAERKLLRGQESSNQADMGHALHVYFNLSELPAAVEMLVGKKVTSLSHKARNAFDFHKLMAGSRALGQSSLHENVWSSLKGLVSEMEEDTIGAFHLQLVLAKKHDPVSHVAFLSVVPQGESLIDRFWTQAVSVFERSMSHAVQPGKSTPVREVLVHSFPKLCSLMESSLEHLSKRCTEKGKSPAMGPAHLQELLGSCLSVQNVFAARSLTHMTDAIGGVFLSGSRSIPPSTEIQKLVSVFHEEMKQAESSVHTSRIVANNVANAVCSIAEKVQMISAAGPELRTVGSSCTSAQLRNISLCSSLQEIHRSLVVLITKLDQKAVEFLVPACETLKTTALELIAPIFKAFVESLEQQLLSMHGLAVWSGQTGDGNPSVYIRELRSQLRTFSMEFLARFSPPFSPGTPSFVRSLVKRVTNRLILFFIRHAALLRPLSSFGREQLSRDAAELENVLTQTIYPVPSLQHHSGTLHAFRELVRTDPSEIRNRPGVMELPRSVILHHLFSRASVELKLPHERIGLTPSQFSFWLDSHTEEEAILSVRSTLDAIAPVEGDGTIRAVLSDLESTC